MKRPERLYLQDIIEACDAIQRFLLLREKVTALLQQLAEDSQP